MKMIKISRKTICLFFYSLIITTIGCFSAYYHSPLICIVRFLFMGLFTYVCIDTNQSDDYKPAKIVTVIIVAQLILEWPSRVLEFIGTLGSLPNSIFSLMGVLFGWLLTRKRKVWLLLIVCAAILCLTIVLYDVFHLSDEIMDILELRYFDKKG